MQEMTEVAGCIIDTATPTEKIKENIAHNLNGGYLKIENSVDFREGRPIAIVGGGPSLKSQIEELSKFDVIIACGSVHDYLIENRIVPTYCVIVDPDPLVNTYLKKAFTVARETTYLVSSQCDVSTFSYLTGIGCKVVLWNAGGRDENFTTDVYAIGGGCTVGTRAVVIAMCFGYKNIHLFGMDTCLDETDEHHAYKFQNEEIETIGKVIEISLDTATGKKFKVAGYMLGQLFDFKHIMATCANKMQLTVHGGGLIAHLLDIAKQKHLELQNGKPK